MYRFKKWLIVSTLISRSFTCCYAGEYGDGIAKGARSASPTFIDPSNFPVDLNLGGVLPSAYDNAKEQGKEREVRVAALSYLINSLHWAPELFKINGANYDKDKLDQLIPEGKLTLNLSRVIDGTKLAGFLKNESYPYSCSRDGLPRKGEGFRLDWLISQANQNENYKAILGLPDDLNKLKKSLGLNTEFLNNRSIYGAIGQNRYGSPESGIALGVSRVFENQYQELNKEFGLHQWRQTYDTVFNPKRGRDTDLRNFFVHPQKFEADGSEVIFHLPNFFNGYILANNKGKLIGEAPIDLVKNGTEPAYGEVLKNPFSCMTCHASSVNLTAASMEAGKRLSPLRDTLLQKQEKAPGKRLSAEEQEILNELNVALDHTRVTLDTDEAHNKLAAEDDKKTHDSIQKAGASVAKFVPPQEAPRMMPNFTLAYERPLTIEQMAKELGKIEGTDVSQEELKKVLADPVSNLVNEKLHYTEGTEKISRRPFETSFCDVRIAVAEYRRKNLRTQTEESSRQGIPRGTATTGEAHAQ